MKLVLRAVPRAKTWTGLRLGNKDRYEGGTTHSKFGYSDKISDSDQLPKLDIFVTRTKKG